MSTAQTRWPQWSLFALYTRIIDYGTIDIALPCNTRRHLTMLAWGRSHLAFITCWDYTTTNTAPHPPHGILATQHNKLLFTSSQSGPGEGAGTWSPWQECSEPSAATAGDTDQRRKHTSWPRLCTLIIHKCLRSCKIWGCAVWEICYFLADTLLLLFVKPIHQMHGTKCLGWRSLGGCLKVLLTPTVFTKKK